MDGLVFPLPGLTHTQYLRASSLFSPSSRSPASKKISYPLCNNYIPKQKEGAPLTPECARGNGLIMNESRGALFFSFSIPPPPRPPGRKTPPPPPSTAEMDPSERFCSPDAHFLVGLVSLYHPIQACPFGNAVTLYAHPQGHPHTFSPSFADGRNNVCLVRGRKYRLAYSLLSV